MNQLNQIDDITLIKSLGSGSFGEVFLSTKKGKKEFFATKKIDRKTADQPSFKKYFENEIVILRSLNHPNIVRLEDLKKTTNYYYIVMEYINGGSLTDCLNKYKLKYGRAFPEDILQYIMRQIVDAIKYIHSRKIIHRDLKLDNIMVSFDNDNDKKNLNMMRARVKIIDFGLSIKLSNNNMAYSALGSPINMDPLILNKFLKKGRNINKLGYDSKADIWSLGTICYELLIGEAVFDAETLNGLVQKVENGSYSVPTSLSKEIVSFLNGMLQYDGDKRLSAEELSKHDFLIKKINEFTKIDTRRVSKKINNKGLNINIKKNQTIWAIFNEEDENKLLNIKGGKHLSDNKNDKGYLTRDKRANTSSNIPINVYNNQNFINKNYQKSFSNQFPDLGKYSRGESFYGQKMYPSLDEMNKSAKNPQTSGNFVMQQANLMPYNQMSNYSGF